MNDNKMNKIKRAAEIAFVVCFVLFVGALSVLTVIKDKSTRYSYFENRTRASAPEITKAGILDGSFMADVETYAKEYVSLRDEWLTADTYMNLLLHRPVINGVVITTSALLTHISYTTESDETINVAVNSVASRLKAHSDQVSAYGGHFLYVAVPCQYVCYEDAYPWYLENRADYTAKSSAALFTALRASGVDYVDMREVFGSSAKEYSSTIDNHFGIDGAYLTYRAIIEQINMNGGIQVELMGKDNFDRVELPNRYLGSRTRKLLGAWKSDEKLSVLYPKVDIPFTRTDNGEPVDNVVYDIPDAGKDALYGVYMGGDIGATLIDTNRPDKPTVLIYGDSFTNAVECVALVSFDKMYSYDFRYYKDKPLASLIDEIKPDYVICIRDYEAMLSGYDNGQ